MSDNGALPRLVLIEDNPGDAVLVREMLRSSWPGDFAFDHFDRVAAAREHLLRADATCILLDLSLPDAHGLEAVDRVQSFAPDVPIVVLNGLDDEEMAVRAVQGGAQDYLIKGGSTTTWCRARSATRSSASGPRSHSPTTPFTTP